MATIADVSDDELTAILEVALRKPAFKAADLTWLLRQDIKDVAKSFGVPLAVKAGSATSTRPCCRT